MKAAVVDGKSPPVIRNIDPPSIKTPYDVLCENLYCATCTGTDLHIIRGTFPHPVRYPTVLGHEGIGRVVEVGGKVRAFKIGDLVTRTGVQETKDLAVNWGGLSEYGLARDHFAMRLDGIDEAESRPYRVNWTVPDGIIDPIDATMIITWRENLSYVMRLGIGKGSRVLVSGSGANGLGLARMAVLQGASYVCMAGSLSRKKEAESLEINEYLDYKNKDELEKYGRENKDRLDFIIDATGKNGSLNAFLPCIRRGGTIANYGKDDYQSYVIPPFLAGTSFFFYNNGYDVYEAHIPVLDFIRQGRLNAGVWIDRKSIFSLDDTTAAYEFVEQKKAIKIAIHIRGN